MFIYEQSYTYMNIVTSVTATMGYTVPVAHEGSPYIF